MCSQCQSMKALNRYQCLKLHFQKGMPLKEIAHLMDCHPNTLSRWKQRYLTEGLEGLQDRSRAPYHHPNEYSSDIKSKIKQLRASGSNRRTLGPITIQKRLQTNYGIHISRSGIAKYLHREGLTRPPKSRRRKQQRLKRWKIKQPGGLIQLDVKYAFKSYGDHWFYQYSSIDYLTSLVYGCLYELQSNLEGVLFTTSLNSFYPFNVARIQTDNHSTFTNRYTGYLKSEQPLPRLHAFDLNCQELGIQHYLIDKGKPAQNGKVERFHRTCEEEFYQRERLTTLQQARKKFRDFLYYYNHEREHQGLDNLTPLEKLQTFPQYVNIREVV